MVIVEGPDGAGKSGLIGRLIEDVGLNKAHRACTSEDGPVPSLKTWVDDDMKLNGANLIYDRHPLFSEPIYGPVVRGSMAPGFDGDWLRRSHLRLNLRHPLVVYCLPYKDTVIRNVYQSHDGGTKFQQHVCDSIEAIYDLYVAQYAASWSADHTLVWGYDRTPGDPLFYSYTDIARVIRDHVAAG